MHPMAHEYQWNRSPANVTLSQEDVHVWCASLDQSRERVQWLARTLNAEERVRARRFYFEQDRMRFIVAHGLLRTMLGHYSGTRPGRLRFRYSAQGKPSLARTFAGDGLRFNQARSHGLALYAFTLNREIGVDLQAIRLVSQAEWVTKRLFSDQEMLVFQALAEHEKQEAFFRYWTCKEAYVKASGEGLAQPLDQVDVSLAAEKPAKLLGINGDVQAASRWSLQELKPATGLAAALVVEGFGYHLACWQWSEP